MRRRTEWTLVRCSENTVCDCLVDHKETCSLFHNVDESTNPRVFQLQREIQQTDMEIAAQKIKIQNTANPTLRVSGRLLSTSSLLLSLNFHL